MRKNYKLLFRITLLLLVVMTCLFCFLWHRENYTVRVARRLGLIESVPPRRVDLEGWTNCLKKLNIHADAVFVGDSITVPGEFQEYFADRVFAQVVNLGISGDSLRAMRQRIDLMASVYPKKVFVMCGINGFADLGIDGTVREYEALLTDMKKGLPDSEIYVQSILPIDERATYHPSSACWDKILPANKAIERLCGDLGLRYIDLFSLYVDERGQLSEDASSDGVHVNKDGFARWYKAVEPFLLNVRD